jgi:hypothetical protein
MRLSIEEALRAKIKRQLTLLQTAYDDLNSRRWAEMDSTQRQLMGNIQKELRNEA